MAAEVFAVGELGNCPFRGGDREGQRQCEGPTVCAGAGIRRT